MLFDVCSRPHNIGDGWRRYAPGIGVEAATARDAIIASGLCENYMHFLKDDRRDGTPEKPYHVPESDICAIAYVPWNVEITYVDAKVSPDRKIHIEKGVMASNSVTAAAEGEHQAAARVPWSEIISSHATKVSHAPEAAA